MAETNQVVLTLDELLPDRGGDIVFEGSVDGLVVVTDQPVLASGVSEAHITAAGVDVTGYCYYSLGSGVTLYSPVDLLLSHSALG